MKVAHWVRQWAAWVVGVALLVGSWIPAASAQLLLRDDFDGAGNVDTTVWRLPFGDSEGTYVGRTQYRGDAATDLPQQGAVEASAEDGKVMEVNLDTYSPIDPGNQFLGTDVLTKRNFARAGGISYEARMRLKPTTVGGLVGAGFLYDVTRQSPPGTDVRDEIDVELISNQTVGAATQDPFTNVWNDGSFSSAGNGGYVDVAGMDLTQFHDYRVDWSPQSVKWYVDDQLVRTVTTGVPDDPMQMHFNLWAPDTDFADAYNAALEPVATAGENTTYTLQVDHVEVNRLNTTTSANLLSNAGFEDDAPTYITDVPATTTGEWLYFNNASWGFDDPGGTDTTIPDAAHDADQGGIAMEKMFGPFNGGPDASGVLQNVAASPGQQFEASAWVQTPSGDSILGTQNYTTVQIAFLDSTGAVIEDAPYVPTDGHDFPLLDGRDPNLQEDAWINGVVDAVAPAGTAYARISLFFLQLNNEGGAAWFDDASLVLLTPDVVPLNGDYNGDGIVDAADYTVWRDTLGQAVGTPGDGADGNMSGTIDEGDYTVWKDNFGMTAGSGSLATSTAVPEPCAWLLLVIGLASGLAFRRPAARNS